VAAAAVYFSLPSRRGSNFLFVVAARRGNNFLFSIAARQRQIFSRDGHLCYLMREVPSQKLFVT
jgi:hypothetical protein